MYFKSDFFCLTHYWSYFYYSLLLQFKTWVIAPHVFCNTEPEVAPRLCICLLVLMHGHHQATFTFYVYFNCNNYKGAGDLVFSFHHQHPTNICWLHMHWFHTCISKLLSNASNLLRCIYLRCILHRYDLWGQKQCAAGSLHFPLGMLSKHRYGNCVEYERAFWKRHSLMYFSHYFSMSIIKHFLGSFFLFLSFFYASFWWWIFLHTNFPMLIVPCWSRELELHQSPAIGLKRSQRTFGAGLWGLWGCEKIGVFLCHQ